MKYNFCGKFSGNVAGDFADEVAKCGMAFGMNAYHERSIVIPRISCNAWEEYSDVINRDRSTANLIFLPLKSLYFLPDFTKT